MKMLYILNVANRVNNFCMSSILAAKKLDIEYHIAGNWNYANDEERKKDEEKYGIFIHQIDFIRSPMDVRNYKAYQQLDELVGREKFDVIHCNTPIGGLLGRIVGKKHKVKTIIYQVHGFHFYKGSPKQNWLIYYPIEKWLARYTDMLITINQEDYELAKAKMRLKKGGKVYYVPGVGIEWQQYQPEENEKLRETLGIQDTDIMIISLGDLVERKNYKASIQAIAEANLPHIKYCICGTGPQQDDLAQYAESLGVEEQILFLGFRTDVKELLKTSDIFLFTTKQEGLARSMMEAMAAGLPCVASEIRGNVDLIKQSRNGFLCKLSDADAFAESIKLLASDEELRNKMSQNNLEDIKKFDIVNIVDVTTKIYTELM